MTKNTNCEILRPAHGHDSTNGGLTGRSNSPVTLALTDADLKALGVLAIRLQSTSRPADLRLAVRPLGGWMAVPVEGARPGMVGPMFGGNYIMAPGLPFPIPVHDRYETPAQYHALSR